VNATTLVCHANYDCDRAGGIFWSPECGSGPRSQVRHDRGVILLSLHQYFCISRITDIRKSQKEDAMEKPDITEVVLRNMPRRRCAHGDTRWLGAARGVPP